MIASTLRADILISLMLFQRLNGIYVFVQREGKEILKNPFCGKYAKTYLDKKKVFERK